MRACSGLLLSWMCAAAIACNGSNDTPGSGGSGGSGGTPPATTAGTGGAPMVTDDPAIAMIQAQIDAARIDRTRPGWRTSLPKPTPPTFTAGRSYFWTLATSKGELRLRLAPDAAPMHVTSTIYLTLLGFYDSLTFHRIIKGFMAQGGDPLGTGRGSPGYSFAIEVSAAARHDTRGVLSMANAGPDTEGSQFFITFGPQPRLDGKYSVFGKLDSGTEALDAIEAVGTAGEGTPGPVTITGATVTVQ
jgi:peptidyl-prolyl cis-trans isomerase B (cyclophilin B)